MDNASIFARIAGGLIVKASAIGFALYAGHAVYAYVSHVFGVIDHVL